MTDAAGRTASWTAVVVVPARDEEERITACLRSVLDARLPSGVGRWVVVVADRCTDATARTATDLLGDRGEVVCSWHGSVGAARRDGVDAALTTLAGRGIAADTCWILSTDADSTVAPDWFEVHLGLADAGALAVAGTVVVDSFAAHPAPVATRFAHRYVVGLDGFHDHVHGTNLGVRADAYLAVGGWGDERTAEDHALWSRLRSAHGDRCRATDRAPVTTSGRAVGRAPEGFAGLLCSLADDLESDVA